MAKAKIGEARVEIVDGQTTFYLAFPFKTQDGELISSLSMRRFTMADNAIISKLKDGEEIIRRRMMMSAGLSENDYNRIDAGDASAMWDVIESFLVSTVKTVD